MEIHSLHLASESGAKMKEFPFVIVSTKPNGLKRESHIILMELKAFRLIQEETLDLEFQETGRQIITEKGDLKNLINERFQIGDSAILKGVKMYELYSLIENHFGPKQENKSIAPMKLSHNWLKAKILESGTIHKGDEIEII